MCAAGRRPSAGHRTQDTRHQTQDAERPGAESERATARWGGEGRGRTGVIPGGGAKVYRFGIYAWGEFIG